MAKKPKQTELPEVGKRDAVGRAAIAYLDARQAITDAKDALESKGERLIVEMQKAKRREIKLEGVTIALRHIESQDWLRVRKAKKTSAK